MNADYFPIARLMISSLACPPSLQSWTAKFGSPVVAQLYLDATSKPTGFDTKGQQRSPAGEFVHLAIGLEREQALG